jgi:hypothetical protein
MHTVAALTIEPLGILICGGKTREFLLIIETSLPFPPTLFDPSGSIFNNASVANGEVFLKQFASIWRMRKSNKNLLPDVTL